MIKTHNEHTYTVPAETKSEEGRLIPMSELPPFVLTCRDADLVLHAMNEYAHQKGPFGLSPTTTKLMERLNYYIAGGALLEWKMYKKRRFPSG